MRHFRDTKYSHNIQSNVKQYINEVRFRKECYCEAYTNVSNHYIFPTAGNGYPKDSHPKETLGFSEEIPHR